MTPHLTARADLVAPPGMTYEEFLAWVPDGVQAEWVDGEVTIMTTSDRHAALEEFLGTLLALFVRLHGLGRVIFAPFQVRLAGGRSGREPDLLVVLTARRSQLERYWLDGPADLVVELISADSVQRDTVEKRQEYAAAGVPEYLLVDAREGRAGVDLLRLEPDGTYATVMPDTQGRLHSTVLLGFWLDPAWLTAPVPPDPLRCLLQIAPDRLRRVLTEG